MAPGNSSTPGWEELWDSSVLLPLGWGNSGVCSVVSPGDSAEVHNSSTHCGNCTIMNAFLNLFLIGR